MFQLGGLGDVQVVYNTRLVETPSVEEIRNAAAAHCASIHLAKTR